MSEKCPFSASLLLCCWSASSDRQRPRLTRSRRFPSQARRRGPALAPSSHELAILRTVNNIRGGMAVAAQPRARLHRAARAHPWTWFVAGTSITEHGSNAYAASAFADEPRGEHAYATSPASTLGSSCRCGYESSPSVGVTRFEIQQDRCRRGRWLDATRDSRLRRLARGYSTKTGRVALPLLAAGAPALYSIRGPEALRSAPVGSLRPPRARHRSRRP